MRHPIRSALATSVLLAVAAATVQAQQALVEVEEEDMMIEPLGMSVDELDDTDLLDAAGETIGEIDDVLMTPEGVVSAVTVEVGGFLGIGERNAVVPLEDIARVGDELRTELSREAIEALPEHDD